MRKIKDFSYGLPVCAGLALLLVIFAGVSFRLDSIGLYGGRMESFSSGWTDVFSQTQAELPATVSGQGQAVLENILPETFQSTDVLFVRTFDQRISIRLNGKEIYRFGYYPKPAFGTLFGAAWHLVPLETARPGDQIRVEIETLSKQKPIYVYGMDLGDKGDIVLTLIYKNLARILSCICYTLLGCIFWGLSALFRRRFKYGGREFGYLAWFLILAAVWLLFDSGVPQLFTGHQAVCNLLSFFSFMLLPIPFLRYVYWICGRRPKELAILANAAMVLFVVLTALYVLNWTELYSTLWINHCFLLLCVILILRVCFREYKKFHNRESRWLIVGLAVLALGAVIQVPVYYFRVAEDYTQIFRWGLFLFILCLCACGVGQLSGMLRDTVHSRAYRQMAFHDAMTGAANRAAFEARRVQIEQARQGTFELILFDLDRLKSVNDSCGHEAGDQMICHFADCVFQVMLQKDHFYRIGGDEFAVILQDGEDSAQQLLKRLQNGVEEANKVYQQRVAYSWGCAQAQCGGGQGISFQDLYSRADQMLYEHKNLRKSASNS